MVNCSSSAGSKFGFGEVEKGGETMSCKKRLILLNCSVLWNSEMQFQVLCLCFMMSCEIRPKFSLAVRSWETLSSTWWIKMRYHLVRRYRWCSGSDVGDAVGQQQLPQPGGLRAFAGFLILLLLILNSRESSTAARKGKPSRAGALMRGRVVPWMEQERGVIRIQC